MSHKQELAYPVLEAVAADMSNEYVMMLGRLNAAIANVLRRGRGSVEKGGLFLLDGGLDDLVKAEKVKRLHEGGAYIEDNTMPRKKSKGASPKKDDRDKQDVKTPGSRGGKWWRDKHGHVRYGPKPSDDDDREWAAVSDEDAKKMYESLEVTYGYHSDVTAEMDRIMKGNFGIDPEVLVRLFRDANAYGVGLADYWGGLCSDAGLSEEEAATALSEMMEAYKSTLNNPEFKKVAKRAVEKRKLEELHAANALKLSAKYSKGSLDSLLKGNSGDSALKLLGMLSDMKFFHIPNTYNEARESFTDKQEAKKRVGNIVPNPTRMEAAFRRIGDLTGEQLVGAWISQRFRDREAASGASKDVQDSYSFRGEDGFNDTLLDEGGDSQSAEQELNEQLNNIVLQYVTGEDEPSDEQREAAARKLNEIGAHIADLIDAYNDDQGGLELASIFTKTFPPEKLFRDESATRALREDVERKKQVIEKALAAQLDTGFKTPKGMEAGFKKMSEEWGKEADLIDYQRQALGWMDAINRGILAYDTGMGKTPISIGFIAHLQELAKQGKISKEDARGIMVMPLGLTKQWPNEIRKFFPDAKVLLIGDDIQNVDDRIALLKAVQEGKTEADFVIMSASVVNFTNDTREAFKASELFEEKGDGTVGTKKGVKEEEVIQAMRDAAASDKLATALRELKGCVFFDEAHHESQGLKNPLNMHNAVAREFLKDRERSFLLTATPMPNGKPEELFQLMDLINPGSAGPHPRKFANKASSFTQTVLNADGEEEVQVSDDWAKASKDVAPFVFRKKKTEPDVLAANKKAGIKLPKLNSHAHTLHMPPEIGALMEKAGNIKPHDYDERQSKLKEGKRKPWQPMDAMAPYAQKLRALHQMQQLSVTPKLLLGDSYKGPEPKLDHLADLVLNHFDNKDNVDSPIIVFSQWPSAFKYAKEKLISKGVDPSLIGEFHGSVDGDERQAAVEATNAGKLKVIFVGTQAGGAGLNLQQKARKGIFLDQPWAPAQKIQAQGRYWRTGNDAPEVDAIDLHLNAPIDVQKLASLEGKVAMDSYMTGAKDGGDAAQAVFMGQVAQLLGGAAIRKKTDAEIQEELDALGLKDIGVAPKDLRGSFDLKSFGDTMNFKRFIEFGDASFDSQRTLARVKKQTGEMDEDEFNRSMRRLAKEERDWAGAKRLYSRKKVMVSKDADTFQPETEYVHNESAKIDTSTLSEMAQAVYNTVKKNKGQPLTVSDFIDDHLAGEMDKEVKRDKDGKPLDKHGHLASSKKWHDERGNISKLVETAMRELQKKGLISERGTKPTAQKNVPLPKPTKEEKPSKARVEAKGKSAPVSKPKMAEKNETEQLKIKPVKGSGASMAKKHPEPFVSGLETGLAVLFLSENAKKVKSISDVKNLFGKNGINVSEAKCQQLVNNMRKWGYL